MTTLKKWSNWTFIVIMLFTFILLSACGNNGMEPNRQNFDQPQRIYPQTPQTPQAPQTQQGQANSAGLHQNTRMEMSKEIAENIADMQEVEMANVLLTDQNAYISVVLENDNQNRRAGMQGMSQTSNEVDEQLSNKIKNRVLSVKPDIERVFISANPDFLERMNGFIDQIQAGRPVQGFVNEFNTMVERMFPDNVEANQ